MPSKIDLTDQRFGRLLVIREATEAKKTMNKFNKNDVVQFNEDHELVGCFGFIDEIKEVGDDIRYMIGVPMPSKGTAYIFSMESRDELEYIGKAVLIPGGSETEDD